ncbi:MAG: HlyD family efflux transporter periplasmic adaptor subunit [Pseudomonadota bacterium]
MHVIRDRPSARMGYAIAAPLSVSIEGGPRARAKSWSMRGVLLPDGVWPVGKTRARARLFLDFQGYEIAIDVTFEAVDGNACDFINLPQRSRALLEQFVEDLMHGRMTATDDALLRIDTPEDPISIEPDQTPAATGTLRRRLRPVAMTVFYLVLGLVVFGYVGILIHANFVKLEVQTAVVSRPVEVFAMPVDGQVAAYRTRVGAQVRAGDLLAVVSDPELDAKIDDLRIELSAAEAAISRLRATIEIERARMADYQVINETDARITTAEVEGLKDDQDRTARHLERIVQLKRKGYATQAQLDEALAADALAKSRLTSARLMAARKWTLHDVAVRRHHNGREFIVDLDLLAVDLTAARSARDGAAARLAVLLERKAALAVIAPFDGRILDVLRARNTPLLRGTSLISMEHDVPPVVEAYLNQEEILQVGMGDTATVFLPSIDRKVGAVVARIDRTSGFVDEQEAQYIWRGPKDRSARVVLTLEDGAQTIASGLPAIVLFDRRDTDAVRQDLTAGLSAVGDDV